MKVKCVRKFLIRLILALVILSGGLSVAGQQPDTSPTRAEEPAPVFLSVTLINRQQQCLTGLDRTKFAILVDNVPQEITALVSAESPASVLILFDVSGSMKENIFYRRPQYLQEAFARFRKENKATNEYLLLGFNTSASVLLTWTKDADALMKSLEQISTLPPRRTSEIHLATEIAIKEFQERVNPKRAILLITDVRERGAFYQSLDALRPILQASNLVIYGIYIGEAIPGRPQWHSGLPDFRGEQDLSNLVEATGGLFFRPRSREEFNDVLGQIGHELGCQYVIGFRAPAGLRNGKRYSLKVAVNLPPTASHTAKTMTARSRDYFVSTK